MTRRLREKTIAGKYVFWPLWALCGVLLLSLMYVFVRIYIDERPKGSDIAVVDIPETREIRLQTADFHLGELHLFHVSGTGIILAVKRLKDWRVHAALSSCTVCSRQGHNSYAKRDQLFCGICNQPMRFENDTVAARTAKNQCPLPEVPISEQGGTIVIASKDVLRIADRALMK
ncbi:MAG: Fe-S-containing protein [Terriglobia bacterium]|jgi:uncharacterized membrane protein|nr:Fe-S-containing protein [Terriglobia bacterium]